MIKVGVFYPIASKFNWDYYLNKHTPMIKQLMGAALKKVEVEQGLGGAAPGTGATYVAICHLHFDSAATFHTVLAAHGAKITADFPNYTTLPPVIQVSEVKL